METKHAIPAQQLALFLGCRIQTKHRTPQGEGLPMKKEIGTLVGIDMLAPTRADVQFDFEKPLDSTMLDIVDLKPILRSFSSITDQEAEELAIMVFNNNETRSDEKVTQEEISVLVKKAKDDGCATIVVSCRCFDGRISIHKNGDIFLHDEDLEQRDIRNHVDIFLWMLSKHFDVFRWIEKGLALDREITQMLQYGTKTHIK